MICTHIIVHMRLDIYHCSYIIVLHAPITTVNIVESSVIIHGVGSGSEFIEHRNLQCVFIASSCFCFDCPDEWTKWKQNFENRFIVHSDYPSKLKKDRPVPCYMHCEKMQQLGCH